MTGLIKSTPYAVRVGAYSGGNYWNGTIDEVRIYNRALSSAEISALYLSGKDAHIMTNSTGVYSAIYSYSSASAITSVNFTVNATDSDGIYNYTIGAITVYPTITVDTWTSTTSACTDRVSTFNITIQKYLCANVTYGTSKTAGAYVNFSVSDTGSNSYGPANPVFTNNSVYDSGTIVSSPLNISESTSYRVTATAWNPSVNALITTSDTYDFSYGQLNISANLTDYVVMPDATINITGNIFDWFNALWLRISTFVRIFLDGTELTNGGHYTKTWTTNADFSNGTSVNVTNSSNSIILDPRGQYYFEAENYLSSRNFTNGTDGNPSGGKYIGATNLPAWATYNITGIPNGTYYVFLKLYAEDLTYMVNVTWNGVLVNTTNRSAGYSMSVLWSDNLITPVIVNSTSHILGINSTSNYPSIDVILLTTNASYIPNDTSQNYVSTPLKYNGNFVSNKTTDSYAIISITPNWTSSEPAGSNITMDISADNGATWCANVTKREYRANESCGNIGTGTELIWRANLSASIAPTALRLINVTMLYETGNTTKTNSSGFFSFLFNALKTLGQHNITINATDEYNISGNVSVSYLVDNLTITTDTTPNTIDVDTLSENITVTINSNSGRTSGRRYNITANISKPGGSSEIVANSSFSCNNNYPMTCNAIWAPSAQPLGYYNVTISFEDNESISGTNTTVNDFDVDNITTTIASSDIAPVIAKNITISGTANTYSTSVLSIANVTLTTSVGPHFCGYNTSMSGTQYNWTMNCSITSATYSNELGPANITVRINDTTGNINGVNSTQISIWAPSKVNGTATDYVLDIDEGPFNITGYYWRTDVLSTIPGEINITINGTTKSCSSAASCQKTFTIGPGNDIVSAGVYNVRINASNNSAYYIQNSTQFDITINNITTTIRPDKTLYLVGETIAVNGTANYTLNGSAVQSNLVNVWIDNSKVNWWNASWLNRKAIAISSTASSANDYQINFTVNWTAGMNTTFDDLRFTLSGTNGESALPYWIQNYSSGSNATVWIKANLTNRQNTVYMYYNNPSATTTSSFDAVFTKEYNASGANDTGLVGEWHFDKGSGTIAPDSSGYGNTGTLYNGSQVCGGNSTFNDTCPQWQSTDGGQWDNRSDVRFASGSALQFDGVDDYVDVGNGASLDSNTGTWELWVNPNPTTYTWGDTIIMHGWDSNTRLAIVYDGVSKLVSVSERNGGEAWPYKWTWSSATNSVPVGRWMHIVVTQNGTAPKIYFNGQLMGEVSQGSNLSAWTSSITSNHNSFGERIGDGYFNGSIDEVRIYNRSLSVDEIYRHHIRSKYATPKPSVLSFGAAENVTMTNATGGWNSAFAAPQWLGVHTLKANLSDADGIYGMNATTIEIWAQSKVNYTNSTSHAGTNTEYNITGNYFRTDMANDEAIPGLINITVLNSTYLLSKTCSGAATCLKNFTIGPSGELMGGNYTVWVNASNNSAYYMPNSTVYNIYLEEPKATGTLNMPDKVISDMVFGVDYSYLENITLNNTNAATMYSPLLNETIDYGVCTKIKSVANTTSKSCSNKAPNVACIAEFNITISGTACGTPPCDIQCLDWNSNWTNNDGTTSSATNTAYNIHISGNPDIGASMSLINITDNIGSPNITEVTISNTGNEILGTSGIPAYSVFVNLTNSTIPSSWITFLSTDTWAAPNYWDYIPKSMGYVLTVNTTAANYSAGTYTGVINITSYSVTAGLQAYTEINISITIAPNISISQNKINHTQVIGSPNITNITVSSTGNSPITNVTATYITETMPASWISLYSSNASWNASASAFNRITEYTSDTLTVNITAQSYAPGTYTGKINITTNENPNKLINISVTISPAISINKSSINITQNISAANITLILINNTGNAPITNVTITLTNSTIPQSWISLSSQDSDWNSGTSSFSRIAETTNRTLNLTIRATNYTEGTYTGILNITSNENQNTQINLSITITPNATTYNINKAEEHGRTTQVYHIINSTGNAPLINATATYIESTLPASWIALNYSGQSGQSVSVGNITEGAYKNITVEIAIPQFQDPGNYVGYINTSFDNEPTQQITVTLTVNTNSSWHIDPPANRTNTFILSQNGVIGNVTIVNTGNVPLNYTVTYTTNAVCDSYTCMSGGTSAGYNNASAYVPKNSNKTFGIWQLGDSSTHTNAQIMANISNASTTPAYDLAYMFWNITNAPSILVNLTTTPKNYVELNKSIVLYAIISDDEALTGSTGLNMSSVYFNVITPSGYSYTINNNSIYSWSASPVPPEADRRKFNYSFANTSAQGIHNLTVYIKDKSNNEINRTIFQFEVISATSINISAATPPTASNVTYLHGENLTVPINITNLGRATAYNITVTGIFANGIAWNRTFSELNESQSMQTNITLEVSLGTAPSTYQLMPKVIWKHPNTTQEENITASNVTVTVGSKYEIMMPANTQTSMNHSEQKTLKILANATGNVNYAGGTSTYIIAGTAPINWTCFGGYCGSTYVEGQTRLPKNTSKNITLYIKVPAGTTPGNYSFAVKYNATSDPNGSTANITITVLEDRSWTYSRPYNVTTFELNTPGIIGIITLNGSGNTETNFTINYSNWSATDYHSYSDLFNESQNNSGTIVNPKSIILQPNELKNITIYQNGYYQGLSNIGINVTVSNSSASPSVQSILLAFNLTETPPNITAITFFNASYVELNKTIGIKVHARDDAALNLSTIRLNITSPLGTTVTVTPDNTSENLTANGEYIRMNYTYLFSSTSAAGNYTANASVSDKYPYSTSSAQYTFEVIGATTMNLSANATSYNISGITQSLGKNITVAINATNTGLVTAYNATLSGNFSSNASAWSVFNVSLGNISASGLSSANLTIYAPAATWPGTYYFTPSISWRQPNGSSAQYVMSPVSVVVASNMTAVFTEYARNFTIPHGTTNSTLIRINSTGNDNATTVTLLKTASNLTVDITPSTISKIVAGNSSDVELNITVPAGTPNNTHTFDIILRNDGVVAGTYTYSVVVPASFSWTKNVNQTTVNGVANQNAIDTSVNITNTGNNPINFIFSLTGNVTGVPSMNLVESQKTVQPLETYAVRLNHTAGYVNDYYEGALEIFNITYDYSEIVTVKYYSYIAELHILNISPSYDVLSGNSINVTTQLAFGASNITENTTYSIAINGSACAITQNTTLGGYVVHTCTAPAIADGKTYSIQANSTYQFSTGPVPLTATNTSAIYYKDITEPNITSHTITSEQEVAKNVTVNLTASDNVNIDSALAEIKYPNGTVYQNMSLSNTTLTNYSAIFAAPQTIGTYTAKYYVNDTTGNVNSAITDSFEIYAWKNFSGTITDLNSNPVSVTFNVTNSSGSLISLFSTNASGYYNATIKKKTYNLRIDVINSTIEIPDVDFSNLNADFIDIDQPMTGDYGYQGKVIKGFAINTSLASSGNITITYTAAEAAGLTTDYFQIYKCVNWDYENRNCNGGLSKLTSTHDKINRKLKAQFSSMTNFILVEDQPVTQPEMTIAASTLSITVPHGTKNIGLLTIQSTGTIALSDIQFTCSSGTACTDFTFAASSIIGLDAGASYDAPINITVPKYYAPGTYEGVLTVESNKLSVYAQYKALTLRVIVPEDNNWTASANLSINEIGSSTSGIAGNIELKNYANVPISFTISPNTAFLTATPEEITIAKNNTDYIAINYTTPRSVNFYNYSINITGTVNLSTNSTPVYMGINVTHAINITSIEPNVNISTGQLITINATASYLDILQTENVSWDVMVDDTLCTSVSSTYDASNWMLICEAPNMSAKLSYTLKLKGTFLNYNGRIAYDKAYDQENIYYVDALPPQIMNQTSSAEQTYGNVTVNASITDYSNITDAAVTVIAPNGTELTSMNLTKITNVTYSMQYNFTEIGDYVLMYTVTDSLNNTGVTDEYFEIYKNMTLSGKVDKGDGSGLQTTFKLYRQNQNYTDANLLQQFETTSTGNYNKTVHNRSYDLEFDMQGNIIRLYNINLANYNSDPIDVDIVSGNDVQITGTQELGGIAVNTSIFATGRITLAYVPTASTKEDNVYIYKCESWNYTDAKCSGTWEKLVRNSGDIDKINNKISVDISGFSAYVAAEVTPPIPVDITGKVSVSGGGGGGSGKDYSGAISEIKQKITTLIEGTSEFSVDTKSISKQLYPGERVNIAVGVKNAINESVRMTVKANGEFANFTEFSNNFVDLGPQEPGTFNMEIFIPKDAYPGNYEGKIVINNGKFDTTVPVSIRILDSKNLPITVDIQPLIDNVAPGALERVKLGIINTGANEIPLKYTVSLVDPVTGVTLFEVAGSTVATSSESIYLNFTIPENITLEDSSSQGLENVKTKRYMIKATATSNDPAMNIKAESVSFISVTEKASILKMKVSGIPVWTIVLFAAMAVLGYAGRKRYLAWASSKRRYAETIDFKSLPQASIRSAFIGKIAETDIRTFLDLDTLQMHTIVAGSTGGGKTVAAQIIVEEALMKGAAVVVFDPTAQWSGFLRPNRDKKMLKTYGKFDMKVGDSRAFNGNIREITDSHQIVDVTKYMNPGEITIFTMNHMDTKDIDFFVANTVKEVFHAGLEGSQNLKLLMVYDEVHRLLAKYGGSGDGFIQLERGVREFRKWGVGLVLISHVLSDFIGTIKANIGTEVQVRSRDESDLERIKMKYGEDMMRSIVKASVGEGLLQNAQYNKGRPYFVSFRPLLHATERLSDEELKKYSKYNTKIDDLKYQIECLKAEAIDVFDIELELKLTSENLMKGKFNMVDIYIEELEPKVAAIWKKLGKEPKKRVVAYASEEDIRKEVERAKREREDYVKMQKAEESKEKAAAENAAASKKKEKEKTEAVQEKTEPLHVAAKPHEWITEKEHKKSRHIREIHDKADRESIKQAVVSDIRKRAKEEDGHTPSSADTREKKQKQQPEKSMAGMEQDLNSLYSQLKEKVEENKKKGNDVSVISLKLITIPSDIKLAAVDENPAEMKKIKGKIEALMNKL